MIYHSLSEIFDAMERTRERLRARLDGIEDGKERVRLSEDSWSVAEIAEHLAIIEERLSKLFPVMIAKAEAGGLRRTEDQPFKPVSLEAILERSRQEKYTAPETARPTGELSLAASLARLDNSRASIVALRSRLEALDLTSTRYPHPVFGPMDAYQWLIFIAAHESRHLRQIESILGPHQAEKT